MIWFEGNRIPHGSWGFMTTIHATLREMESSLAKKVDLTDGSGNFLFTGSMEAYRQVMLRRSIDLAQGSISCWNSSLLVSAIACSRALLETIAIFYAFLSRATEHASQSDWISIGKLIDAYKLYSSVNPEVRTDSEKPPRIGKAVRNFIAQTQRDAMPFWDQICNYAHPNGKPMMHLFGECEANEFILIADQRREISLFAAIYNSLYACCWLGSSGLDWDILIEQMRTGTQLDVEHPLIKGRLFVDSLVQRAVEENGAPRN